MEVKTDRQVISFPRIPVTLVQGVVKFVPRILKSSRITVLILYTAFYLFPWRNIDASL